MDELGGLGFMEDGIDEIDWEHLLDDVPERRLDDDLFSSEGKDNQTDVDSWMGYLEQLLMNDDDKVDHDHDEGGVVNDSEFLIDSPEDQRPSSTDKNSVTCSDSDVNNNTNIDVHKNPNFDPDIPPLDQNEEDMDDDRNSKKRKRQLRNRDAAMRSRERKKMYVKDLEVKSRYLEAECRRLGRLLQCCYADNQMLRISLQSGTTFGSMAKPESAVLLLESLLLGSLVWLMGLMWLPPLLARLLLLLSRDAVALASVNTKEAESAAPPREKGVREASKGCSPPSFLNSKRCKASRIRMKCYCDPIYSC